MSAPGIDALARARDALHAISPDVPREDWIRVGMAAQAAGLPFEVFDAWSSTGATYKARSAAEAWRSFKPDGGIGAGTLFALARKAGWQEGAKANGADHHHRSPGKPNPRPAAQAGAARRRQGASAIEVWAGCEPATDDHPYIKAKNGIRNGLRVVPGSDSLRIAGMSVAGWLVVPVLPLDSDHPVSLQFIPPPGEGRKLNLPGARMDGTFVVGDLQPRGTAYIVEGIGQAWACWRATGDAAVVAFGAGRMREVARELRDRDPAARLVLVPDAGQEGRAWAIAAEVGALVAAMPDGSEPNFDANDYAKAEGHDALEVLLTDAKAPPLTEAAGNAWTPPQPIGIEEMRDARLAPRCIVDNYLFADVATLIAPGSTGKTTMLLYEAICIVLGRSLWGLTVRCPGPVLIVTAEDRREYLVARLRELGRAMRLSDDEWQMVRTGVLIDDMTAQPRKLSAVIEDIVTPSSFAHDIVAGCKAANIQPAVVAFDPLVSFGVGEARVNDAEQGLIEAGRVIVSGLDCCVRFVHHTGKVPALEKRVDQYAGRGGSALADGARMVAVLAAVDAAELAKNAGLTLGEGESAFRIERPKLTYAPPQRAPLYVKRSGYTFDSTLPMSVQDREDAEAEAQRAREVQLRGALLDAVEAAQADGLPLSARTLLDRIRGFKTDHKRAALAALLAEGWLVEAKLPQGWKPVNNSRRAWLVRLSASEREALKATGELPAAALLPPPSIATPAEKGAK
ncbi:MAG: hypothetical protein Fur0019_18900 [Tibeticola sp.]